MDGFEDSNRFERNAYINAYTKCQNEKQFEGKYNEEDLRDAFRQGQDNMVYDEIYGFDSKLTEEEWFEQFKKNSQYQRTLDLCHHDNNLTPKDIVKDIQSLIDVYNLEIIELEKEFKDTCSILTLEELSTLKRVVTNLESKIKKLGDDESNKISLIDKINNLQNKHSNDYEFGQETRKLLLIFNKTN
jgi:hypothetical protein